MTVRRLSPRVSRSFRPSLEPLEERSLPSGVHPSHDPLGGDREVSVMTRNLYFGTELDQATAALASGDPNAIVAAVSQTWANIVASNIPERADAIADEIKDARPLLIGLQEVALFRTGAPDSFFGNPTRAETVRFDFLDSLLTELSERGLHYQVVAVHNGFDAEATGFTAPGVLEDIRLTDRDVVLARSDLPPSQLKLSNVQVGTFNTIASVPIGNTGATFDVLRGWVSVDAKVRGQTFRFISAHLEVDSDVNPILNQIQFAQAQEILNGPANTNLPVLLVGDFNSRADGTGTPTYASLVGAGFDDVWTETHPGQLGNTFGHAPDLRNTTVNLTQRLDLVLFRGDLQPIDSTVVGDELSDRTASGLWPSDHAGVVASLGLHVRPAHRQFSAFLDWAHVFGSDGDERPGHSRSSSSSGSGLLDSALLDLLAHEALRGHGSRS